MNKTELASKVAERLGVSKAQAVDMLTATVEVVTEELVNGGSVKIGGLGQFSVRTSAAREGRNPQTGAPLQLEARGVAKFTAASALKDAVKGTI